MPTVFHVLTRCALQAGLCVIALLTSPAVSASKLNSVDQLDQAGFRSLSKDLGAALSFKPMIPSEGLGLTGLDIGFGVTGTRLEHRSSWQRAASNSAPPATLAVPVIRIHKGLPFDIDVGASLSSIPSTNIKMVAGELRWAVVPGGMLTPALAMRLSATSMRGVAQLDLNTVGIDASISKGFAVFTPYAGIGTVLVNNKPAASTGLSAERFYQSKVFVGTNLNLGLVNLALETDRTGSVTSYGAKVGFRF